MIATLDRLGRAGALIACLLVTAATLYLVLGLVNSLSWDGPGWAPENGQPIGRDFVAFWAAGRLALDGDAAAAYDLAAIQAVEAAVAQHDVNTVPWHYPPTFLLIVLPLAALPYPVAVLVWLVAPAAVLMLLYRRFAGVSAAVPMALIFPATAQCLISGQNGIAFTAVLLAALSWLERRPVLAGLAISLFACKPQLAPLLLPALLFGRCWRTLGAAVAGGTVLVAASWLAFGWDAWRAFLEQIPAAGAMLIDGAKPWARMPTIFAAARIMGLESHVAWLAQGLVALSVAGIVAWIWGEASDPRIRGAVLAAAIPMATPFLFDYDLVLWLIPLAWLTAEAAARSWPAWDRAVLVVGWLGSVGGWLVAWKIGLPAMAAAGLILLGAVLLRLLGQRPSAAGRLAG